MTRHIRKKKYVTADRTQLLLMPPDVRDYVDDDHLAKILVKIVAQLDLRKFYAFYERDDKESRGRPPFDPELVLGLMFYAMAQGIYSSRGMERMTLNDMGARYIAANHSPDHTTFAIFKNRHEAEFQDVFTEIVFLCQRAGLVDFTHVAVDSTVLMANASRAESVEVANLEKLWEDCKKRAATLADKLKEADSIEEAALKAKLKRERRREAKLKEAFAFLHDRQIKQDLIVEEANTLHEKAMEDYKAERMLLGAIIRQNRRDRGWSLGLLGKRSGVSAPMLCRLENGSVPLSLGVRDKLIAAFGIDSSMLPTLADRPSKEALVKLANPRRTNLTDPESTLLYRNNHGYRQGYQAQAAVDSKHQIFLAVEVSKGADDRPSLPSLVYHIFDKFGRVPDVTSADTGYFSEEVLADPRLSGTDLHVRAPKIKRRDDESIPTVKIDLEDPGEKTRGSKMREKLDRPEGKKTYARRSQIVEPTFGQIKENRGFRRFLRKGHSKVTLDWVCLGAVHNILKVVRYASKFLK